MKNHEKVFERKRAEDESIIDAVGSFACRFQTEKYNDDYRRWRKKSDNIYGFDFVTDTKELAYMDGAGFINKKPDVEESKCLRRNMTVIGIAFCVYYLIETFGFILVAQIATLFGFPHSVSLFTEFSTFSTEQSAVIKTVIDILKYLAPILIIGLKLKLPKSVYFPKKVMNSQAFVMSVPLVMLSCAVGYILTYMTGVSLELFSINVNVPEVIFVEGNIPVSLMVAVSTIIINAVVHELLFDGFVFQGLRQFGEGFAILFTAIAAMMMVHDLSQSTCVLIMSLAITYSVLCTGSVSTGIMLRLFYNLTSYASIVLSDYLPSDAAIIVTYSTIVIYLTVGLVWFISAAQKTDNVMLYKFQKTYMKLEEKFTIALVSGVMLVWLVLTFILTTVSVNSTYII